MFFPKKTKSYSDEKYTFWADLFIQMLWLAFILVVQYENDKTGWNSWIATTLTQNIIWENQFTEAFVSIQIKEILHPIIILISLSICHSKPNYISFFLFSMEHKRRYYDDKNNFGPHWLSMCRQKYPMKHVWLKKVSHKVRTWWQSSHFWLICFIKCHGWPFSLVVQ